MNVLDMPIYQCFVCPQLCRDLQVWGVTSEVPYHYRISGTIAELCTYAFDKDDYYAVADKNVDYINGHLDRIPAYAIKDIEKVIPPYLLSKCEEGYELSCEAIWNLPTQKADRLPDVFARMLLESLRQRVVKLNYTNQAILSLNAKY